MSLYFILLTLIIIFYITRLKTILAFSVLFLSGLVWHAGTFIVNEGSVVVLTQFGKIIGTPYNEAGLYFKIPYIWKAIYFDKRIFTEDLLQSEIATKDAYFISIDTVINWRIHDAALFYQNMPDQAAARELLKNIVSGSLREVVAKYALMETLRSSNVKLKLYSVDLFQIKSLDTNLGLHQSVELGREKLAQMVKEQNYEYTLGYGIEIVGVLMKNVHYGLSVEKSIKNRMILERLTKAEELRSTGIKNYQIILGELSRKYQSILAPAKKIAELIKGEADAKATLIYAQAYESNPSFYNFWRTLAAYEIGIPPKSQGAILSTENNFLKLLNGKRTTNGKMVGGPLQSH